jgi:hypothetical protein
MAGMIPLFLIFLRAVENRNKAHRFIYISGGITLVMILLIRALLIVNFLPEKYGKLIKLDVHGWNDFSGKISSLAGDRPVVFVGTYQNPSKYIFYTGKEAHAFNNAVYRGNQFDLEGIEERMQGRDVLLIFTLHDVIPVELEEYGVALSDSILYPNGKYKYYAFVENYRTYNSVTADLLMKDFVFKAGEEIEIPVVLGNRGPDPVIFSDAAPARVFLTYFLLQKGKPVIYNKFQEISSLTLADRYQTSFKIRMPEKPGVYYLKVSVKSGWLPPGINSRLIKVKIE